MTEETTQNYIINAIQKLKRDKTHGSDGMLNEHFIEYRKVFMPILLSGFNGILRSRFLPNDGAKAILIPICKKSNTNDPNNFRGIKSCQQFRKAFHIRSK